MNLKWIGSPVTLSLGALAAIVFILAGIAYSSTTSWNGGVGGYYEFKEDLTVQMFSYQLGLTYTPDIVTIDYVMPRGGKLLPAKSPFFIWTNQVIKDTGSTTNMTGAGYTFGQKPEWGLQFALEVAAMFSYLGEETYKVGIYSGLRMPFEVQGQPYRFNVGGGWDGERPIMVMSLNFATQ